MKAQMEMPVTMIDIEIIGLHRYRWRIWALTRLMALAGLIGGDRIRVDTHVIIGDHADLMHGANEVRESYNRAIDFALNGIGDGTGLGFLDMWQHGEFEYIERRYPDFAIGSERPDPVAS